MLIPRMPGSNDQRHVQKGIDFTSGGGRTWKLFLGGFFFVAIPYQLLGWTAGKISIGQVGSKGHGMMRKPFLVIHIMVRIYDHIDPSIADLSLKCM